MKALTLTQPWATLVAIGAKRVETRSWRTPFTGRMAIHAGKGFPREAQQLCAEEPFLRVLKAAGYTHPDELPRGVILAVVSLQGCSPTETVSDISDTERAFGNYDPDRFAWRFADIVMLEHPIACRGALGLWTVPADVAGYVEAERARS